MSKYNKEELENFILVQNLSYEAVGRIYGVTGNAIKKAAKRLGIELPPRRKINPSEKLNKGNSNKIRYCLNCGKELDYTAKKYCSHFCQSEYEYSSYIERWKRGEENGGKKEVSTYVRKYLFLKNNSKCEKCGWGEIHPVTKLVPLQIHHLDGNYLNNKEENLQLLCPNCHALTETYGSLNNGNGREYRRKNKESNVNSE